MTKNRLLGITGVTGVGKDFLVNAANADAKVRTINLGTLVGEELEMDRDLMMTAAGPAQIRKAQLAAYRRVVTLEPAIVTCHAVREVPGGVGLAYDREMEDIFSPSAYVFVAAPGELVAERVKARNRSGERKSPELSASQIDDEQAAKLQIMGQLAAETACELLVLQNVDPSYAENVRILREQVDRIYAPVNNGVEVR